MSNTGMTNYRRSDVTGENIPLTECRLSIASKSEIISKRKFSGNVITLGTPGKKEWEAITAINMFYWSSLSQDVFGRTYHMNDCRHILAVPDDQIDESHRGIAGHCAFTIEEEGFLHIVVFHVWPEWNGSGAANELLKKAVEEAGVASVGTIKLGTTNDNIQALYFYQRNGFVIEKVEPGEVLRTHGEDLDGFAGIPVRDEFHLRRDIK